MTKAEFLKLIQKKERQEERLRVIEQRLVEQRETLTGLSAVRYDKPVVKSSGGNGNEAAILRYIDGTENAAKRYNAIHDELLACEELLDKCLDLLSKAEYKAVENRYINGYSVEKTSHIMNYSASRVKQLCACAIKKFEKI